MANKKCLEKRKRKKDCTAPYPQKHTTPPPLLRVPSTRRCCEEAQAAPGDRDEVEARRRARVAGEWGGSRSAVRLLVRRGGRPARRGRRGGPEL